MSLLNACKMALEIIAGERIKNDAFPPEQELLIIHDKYVRKCEKELEQAIAEAEQSGISAESRYGRDVKPEKVKPLAQYLAEYLKQEEEDNNVTIFSDMGYFVEQALDAYQSTENVKIRIEPV